MDQNLILTAFLLLAFACVCVPIAVRLGLGSVIGYLMAGVLVGPFCFGLVSDHVTIMHFAEFGVVMMLFLIGLELEPALLWRLRRLIVGFGSLQVIITAAALTLFALLHGWEPKAAIAASLALAMSSTAMVMQTLKEQGQQSTDLGQTAFSVLLFQDIAVIPILLLLPLLAAKGADVGHSASLTAHLPFWGQALAIIAVVAFVILFGKYVSRTVFSLMAKAHLREIFTATTLLLVIGVTILMQAVGLSPALGAFIAGVVLANSEYKRALETDLEPFKGLLLGLFFMSVGMGMDFSLVFTKGADVALIVLGLIVIKALVVFLIAKLFKKDRLSQIGLGLALAQGGEFGFVLFGLSANLGIISPELQKILTLSVALSIMMTPLLMIAYSRLIIPKLTQTQTHDYDAITEKNRVILAGYGRFGQIIARFLRAQAIPVTVLENNPDQIELIRRFGFHTYFGDASRLDLLHQAGAEEADLLIIAIDDAEASVEIVRMSKLHFPNLKIYARARNRRHAYELDKAGVDYYHRELLDSSIQMAVESLIALGHAREDVLRRADLFRAHDVAGLAHSFKMFEDDKALIDLARTRTAELERILKDDAEQQLRP